MMLSVLLLLSCSALCLAWPERVPRHAASVQSASHMQVGLCDNACSAAGFTGCCDFTQVPNNCYVNNPCKCYCDISCHLYNDCCPGIASTCPSAMNTCNELELDNGAVLHLPNNNNMGAGTIARHSCEGGFALVGNGESTIRVCQENGEWSGESLSCQPSCPNLESPGNGRVTYFYPDNVFDTDRLPIRTAAQYSCLEGYLPDPDRPFSSRVCVSDSDGTAHWTGPEPTGVCEPSTCATVFPEDRCCTLSFTDCLLDKYQPLFPNGPEIAEGRCSCHESCFDPNSTRPCCPDIGCKNCAAIQQTQGCCVISDTNSCFAKEGQCFCDRDCTDNDDCCQPVPDQLSCGGELQQSRTGLWSRIQLASELHSMSRVREEPDENEKAQWELIVKELQALKNHKTHSNMQKPKP